MRWAAGVVAARAGHSLALSRVMTSTSHVRIKRKTVWGSKIALAIFLSLSVVAGLTPAAFAKQVGRHRHKGESQRWPGTPSKRTKDYRLDAELTERASRKNSTHTSSVIVT